MFILVLLAACGTPTNIEDGGPLPPKAVVEGRSWLAGLLNVAANNIEIVSMEQVEWTDSCLGLGGPAEICAAVITPGWRVYFQVNGQQYEVRLNASGDITRSPQFK
jgi:hypothetical protein